VNILFVVQRYGPDVAGGAESLCASLATRLVSRGHAATVLTSCARAYETWADHYPPGTSEVDGVQIIRLPVIQERDTERFSSLCERVVPSTNRVAAIVEEAWMREQGPNLAGFSAELLKVSKDQDVVVFMTYLYPTTCLGLPQVSSHVATVLHPAAHDEWPLRLPGIRAAFDHAGAIACSTPEELDLVQTRFRFRRPASVIGIGFDPPEHALDVDGFRARFLRHDRPYVLCLGRIDPNKGTPEASRYFSEFRRRYGDHVDLVLCGEPVMEIAEADGVVVTGFVDDATRWAAISGASVLLQPSYQESFGMTIAEGWTMARPAMVQASCAVTSGLVRRSGGGLTYSGFSEFGAALQVLLSDEHLRNRLGAAGRRFVENHYRWSGVIDRYESLLERAVCSFEASARPAGAPGGEPA